jgi:surface carbohydrate biosynthesis protein
MSIFKRGQDSNKSDCDVVRRMGSTIILETEGQTFDGADRFATDTDKTTIKYTDCHCTRGRIHKDTVAEISPETRTELTGNPRFDLLQKPHRQIYSERANQLNDSYDNYILLNMNFNLNGENYRKQFNNLSPGDE